MAATDAFLSPRGYTGPVVEPTVVEPLLSARSIPSARVVGGEYFRPTYDYAVDYPVTLDGRPLVDARPGLWYDRPYATAPLLPERTPISAYLDNRGLAAARPLNLPYRSSLDLYRPSEYYGSSGYASEIAALRSEIARLRTDSSAVALQRPLDYYGSSAYATEIAALRAEVARLKADGSADLVAMQRNLIAQKDEEIRNLTQLVSAYKEQVALLTRPAVAPLPTATDLSLMSRSRIAYATDPLLSPRRVPLP